MYALESGHRYSKCAVVQNAHTAHLRTQIFDDRTRPTKQAIRQFLAKFKQKQHKSSGLKLDRSFDIITIDMKIVMILAALY